MAKADPILQTKNVTRVLTGEVPVTLVSGANVSFHAGEFSTITGPSGSGKSSLLYLLGLLDKPSSGSVLIDGVDTAPLSQDALAALRLERIGFVFQFHFLLPEFSALENVCLPMRRLGKMKDRAIRERGGELLDKLGLSDHLHKLPKQMSGGQCQRVAIARALANNPHVILADEPTGNLDTAASKVVHGIFRDLAHNENRAVIAVTHEPDFAELADRKVHIVDGRIEKGGD